MKTQMIRWAILDPDTGKLLSAAMCGYAQFKFVHHTKQVKLWSTARGAEKKLEEHKRYVAHCLAADLYKPGYIIPYSLDRLTVIRVVITIEAKIDVLDKRRTSDA